MKKLIKVMLIVLTVGLPTLYGHGSAQHEHKARVSTQEQVTKKTIQNMAKQEIKKLTLAKKIDDSWLFIPISKTKKIQFNNAPEWVVSFNNSKIEDKDKQIIYVFISTYGKVLATNYSGK